LGDGGGGWGVSISLRSVANDNVITRDVQCLLSELIICYQTYSSVYAVNMPISLHPKSKLEKKRGNIDNHSGQNDTQLDHHITSLLYDSPVYWILLEACNEMVSLSLF
jgi:hypothetical protein